MAYEIVRTKSINATNDMSAKQYTFVKIDTNGQIINTVVGNSAIGVLQDKPPASSPGAVCYPGDLTKVQVGIGGIAAGDFVTSDSAGRAVKATSGSWVNGQCIVAASVGQVGVILYQPGYKV